MTMSDPDFNLYAQFHKRFAAHTNTEFLCTAGNKSYRYADAHRKSARIANLLSDVGVKPGRRSKM